jgi:hypothetical protein
MIPDLIEDSSTEVLEDRYVELDTWNTLENATLGACNDHPVYAERFADLNRFGDGAPDWWSNMHEIDKELGKRD